MVVMGFVAILEWDALFLDRRDFAILTPLPLKAATIFAAKIAALLLFSHSSSWTSRAFPPSCTRWWKRRGYGDTRIAFFAYATWSRPTLSRFSAVAHLSSCFLWPSRASSSIFFAPGPSRVVSLCFQVLGDGHASACCSSLLPIISSCSCPVWQQAHGGGWFFWFPPLWFLGVYQTLLGSGGGVFHSLAWTAVLALGLVALACAAGYILNYKRHMQRALEAVGDMHPAGAPGWLAQRGGF